jgi:hypothetical protein
LKKPFRNRDTAGASGSIVSVKKGVDGKADEILPGNNVMKEVLEGLRAITVITEDSDTAMLLHEWMHFMVNFVIPHSGVHRALLEEAVSEKFGNGKKISMENFTQDHHEWLAENFERYIK